MKKYKKILLGVSVLLIASAATFLGISTFKERQAEAQNQCNFAACSETDIDLSRTTFRIINQARITAHFGPSGGGRDVTFIDEDISDGEHEYLAQSGEFCGGEEGVGGVDISGSEWARLLSGEGSIQATVDVDWYNANIITRNPCTDFEDMTVSLTNANNAGRNSYIWVNDDIASVDGRLTLTDKLNNDRFYQASGDCGWAIIVDSANSGREFRLSNWNPPRTGPSPRDAANEPALRANGQPIFAPRTCQVDAGPTVVYIAGQKGTAPPADQDPTGGTSGNADNSCEAMSSTALEWIMCPVFKIAEGFANFLLKIFEELLSFRIDEGYERGVKPAWSAIKNIVSALVIIVMLVMIFAQAASIGPFDAYTIRKLLPRVVAAVVLIQISWYLFAWVINAVDDIGTGLQSLLEAIFSTTTGGVKINDFFELLANAGIGAGRATALNWLLIIPALVIAAAVALPLLLLAMLMAVVALLVAVAVLIFRMILIVTLLLAAPLALLAWVLPGTERYWKMWWDNFLKVLFMFPIIILIIEAGRIFAFIGGLSAKEIPDIGGMIAFLIVVVGFFGPLFLLPKAYKWGGALMVFAGQGMSRVNGAITGKEAFAGKYLRNRQEGLRAERIRRSQERYMRGEGVGFNRNWRRGFGVPSVWRRPIDLARSGQVDPLLWGRRREQAMTGYIAKGAESEEADVKAADARLNQLFKQVDDHDELARAFAAGGVDEHGDPYQYNIRDEQGNITPHRLGRVSRAEIQAGLNAVARFSGNTNMRFLDSRVAQLRESENGLDRVLAKNFLDANVQSLQPRMKHLYYGPNIERGVDSFADNITENSFVGMDPVAAETLLGSLSQRANAGDAMAASRLHRVMSFYRSAIDNETIRPNISAGVNQAIEALVDGNNLATINTARSSVGLPNIEPGATAIPPVSDEASALSGRIDVNGHIAGDVAPAGEVRIEHTQVDTPGAGGIPGATPREEAYSRDELVNLRGRIARGDTLSSAEQRRFEQLRNIFPGQ